MAIREGLVNQGLKFIQEPNVASSPLETKIAFLRSRDLTQEEIDHIIARASGYPPPPPPPGPQQLGFQAYPQYGWQQTPQPPPRRDWRDMFIMATVMSGVGFGLYELGKRYVYPLIAPPTPERLELDKKSIEEQFEKAFSPVDQLAKDTEALKAAEQERTSRLDGALTELETVIAELKSANNRREDEAQRIRADVQNLKESLPKAMGAQKDLTDTRMQEINTELLSLKTLVSQRVSSQATGASLAGPVRPASVGPAPTNGIHKIGVEEKAAVAAEASKAPESSILGKPTAKASIPAWQMAMVNKNENSSSASIGGDAGSAS